MLKRLSVSGEWKKAGDGKAHLKQTSPI